MPCSLRDLLAGRKLASVPPEMTVRAACAVLDEQDIGALAVVADGRLVGILSERDVIRKCICRARRTDETLVRDVMTPDPVTIDVRGSLARALDAMRSGGFRHLPVTDGGAVVGMLSMRDIPTDNRVMLERWQAYHQDRPHPA